MPRQLRRLVRHASLELAPLSVIPSRALHEIVDMKRSSAPLSAAGAGGTSASVRDRCLTAASLFRDEHVVLVERARIRGSRAGASRSATIRRRAHLGGDERRPTPPLARCSPRCGGTIRLPDGTHVT